MGNRHEVDENKRALVLTIIASAAATVFCALQLLMIPADSKNAFLFGLSKERLLMTFAFVVLFCLLILCLIFRNKIFPVLQRRRGIKYLFTAGFVISLFFLLMPDYRFGRAAAIFTRIKPFILWSFLVSALFLIYFAYSENRFASIRETFANLAGHKIYICAALAVLLFGVAFVEITGLGKTAESALWNKNGIPLQSIQLFAAFIIFALLWKSGIFKRLENKKLLSFLLIWAVSAGIWSLAPGINHFFAPGPTEPNNTYYPYSDAAGYDLPAQTALNGWGLNFGNSLLKPTVVFVSFLSHLATGNDTTRSMLFQSALYAVLPAIIYLFGSAIGGAGCGWLAAAFSLLKEWNALRTQTVLTVNSRLVMSEFLTQILFALFCYAVFRWLQRNGNEILYAILSGGLITLGVFTRYNFFAFLPASLLILLIGYRKQFRNLLKPLMFFFLSMLLTAIPLFYREWNIEWNIFKEITYTVKYVLIRQRFNGDDPLTQEDIYNLLYPETADAAASDVKKSKSSQSQNLVDFSKSNKVDFNTSQITQENSNISSGVELPVFASMINHGLHNFISSALTLPMELSFQDLSHLYTQEGDGLWRDNWQGDFSHRQWAGIALWILAGAVTIGILIKKQGFAGGSVLYFWMVYAFSVGFSRSSGGRYIVPLNWIPMLLLAFCCTVILSKGKIVRTDVVSATLPVWQPAAAMAVLISFFTAMTVLESVIPAKITSAGESDLSILKERLADQKNIDWDLVEKQYQEGTLHISHGNAVYPRFYYYLKGEHSTRGALMEKEYSRMTFFGINQDENGSFYHEYMMPHTELVGNFPQDSVYRAVSCTSEFGYEDVLAVTIETPDHEIITYVRDPLGEFSCPVPEPVCPSVNNCR